MGVHPLPEPHIEAARAAYVATANANGALIAFIAIGAALDNPLTLSALGRAIDSVHTAMNRLAEIVAMMPGAKLEDAEADRG